MDADIRRLSPHCCFLLLFVSVVIPLSTAAPWKYRLSQGVWSQLTQVRRVQIPFYVLMLMEGVFEI